MTENPPHVLVVEPNEAGAQLLRDGLAMLGCVVDLWAPAAEIAPHIQSLAPDLLVLATSLPDPGCEAVCGALRRNPETRNLPIVLLAERGADVVRDPYVCASIEKPFLVSEVTAQVRDIFDQGLMLRANHRQRIGDILIDRMSRQVRRAGRAIDLGPTEFRLMDYLMRHAARLITREELLQAIWGSRDRVLMSTVDAYVQRLRRALALEGRGHPIRTVRTLGYALEEAPPT